MKKILSGLVVKWLGGMVVWLMVCLGCLAHAGNDQAGTSGAAFLKLNQSVRAASLGGSFTALADDPSAIFYNPAGLQLSGNSRFSFTQTSWLMDSTYSTLCYTRPIGESDSLGIALSYAGYGSIQETTANSRTGTGRFFTPNSVLSVVSWAHDLRFAYLGVNAKIMRQNIDAYQDEGMGVDLGILTHTPLENLHLGASIFNLGSSGDKVLPQTILIGLNYKTTFGADFVGDLRMPRDANSTLHFGVEYAPMPFLTLRVGFNTRAVEAAGGSYSLGLGLHFSGFNVDYAYVPYADLGDSHRIGVMLDL